MAQKQPPDSVFPCVCRQIYESQRFSDGGFHHYELYFPDGTTPPDPIVSMFLRIAETEPGETLVQLSSFLAVIHLVSSCIKHLSHMSSNSSVDIYKKYIR